MVLPGHVLFLSSYGFAVSYICLVSSKTGWSVGKGSCWRETEPRDAARPRALRHPAAGDRDGLRDGLRDDGLRDGLVPRAPRRRRVGRRLRRRAVPSPAAGGRRGGRSTDASSPRVEFERFPGRDGGVGSFFPAELGARGRGARRSRGTALARAPGDDAEAGGRAGASSPVGERTARRVRSVGHCPTGTRARLRRG